MEWSRRRRQQQDTTVVREDLRPTAVFSERPIGSAENPQGGAEVVRRRLDAKLPASWLGGPATQDLGVWPRNSSGEPLAHVAAFDLADTAKVMGAEQWPFPDAGILHIFHDLQTVGDEGPSDEVV